MRGRRVYAGVATAVLAVAVLVSAGGAGAVNPGTATTTAGQPLIIQIDSPADQATVPAGPLPVAGRAGTPSLPSGTANALYALDSSGSTSSPSGLDCNGDGAVNAADDLNSDGANGDVLDCEVSGVIALNGSLVGSAGVDAGLIEFASSADPLDVDPATAGDQAFTAPGADRD